MRKRTITLSLLVFWGTTVGAQDGFKTSDDVPPLADCDTYAAAPTDPDKLVPGIKITEIEASRAIDACNSAIAAHPQTRRFQLQLARAYDANKQYDLALKWYRLAADKNSPVAQYNISGKYLLGEGVPKDYAEALKWLRLAAEKNYAPAQSGICLAYFGGRGVSKNYVEAVKWCRLAAEQNDERAKFILGEAAYYGNGVPKNYVDALKWWRLSAAQNYAPAINAIGAAYSSGNGVVKNLIEALYWYKLAADQNWSVAQANLGNAYENGLGTPKNYIEAIKWYSLAADQGNKFAIDRLNGAELNRFMHANLVGMTRPVFTPPPPPPTPQPIPRAIAPPTETFDIKFLKSSWELCIYEAHSREKFSSITKHFPDTPLDVSLAQLTDSTFLAKKTSQIAIEYEAERKSCDVKYIGDVKLKSAALASIFQRAISQEQDIWISLIQGKVGWGEFNQKIKTIYTDAEGRETEEIGRLAAEAARSADESVRRDRTQMDQQRAAADQQARDYVQQQRDLEQKQLMDRMAAAQEQAARAQACVAAQQSKANHDNQNANYSGSGSPVLGALAVFSTVAAAWDDAAEIKKYCK